MKHNKIKKFNFKKFFYNIFIGSTAARKLFMFYLYAILLGIIFLSLPISLRTPGVATLGDGTTRDYNFIDSVFTSISAFTDTGLTTINIAGTYNFLGQIIILLLIQTGGLGLFAIYWIVWNFIFNSFIYKKIKKISINENKTIGFSQIIFIDSERGNSKLGLSTQTIKTAIIFIFITEIIFTIIYSLMFGLIPSYEQIDAVNVFTNDKTIEPSTWYIDNTDKYNWFYDNAKYSIWVGLFQSISTMNNAGFDIVGQASYASFRNGIWTVFLYISALQIIIGGIGYPVIYDIVQFFKYKYHRQKFRFSLFTKVTVVTYFLVLLVALLFIIGFEYGLNNDGIVHDLNSMPNVKEVYFGQNKKLYNWNLFTSLFYNVVSSRSNGTSTISANTMSYATKWITIILMFIGCSPSSTGGGIRTTTLAIMFMTGISYMKGFNDTKIFKKTIPNQTVIKSSIIIVDSMVLILLLSFISFPLAQQISGSNGITITDIIFEFASSYGTVGLTSNLCSVLGSSSGINNFSSHIVLLLLTIIMFIGQLGISSTIYVFRRKQTNRVLEYPIEDIKL